MLESGTKAPELGLGERVAKLPQVLIFFKVGCPTCQLTMPFMQRIADGAGGNAAFLAVSQDDASATAEFYETYGLRLPSVLDGKMDNRKERYAMGRAYGIEFVPSVFVISPDGTITHSFTGFVKSEMEALGARFGVETFLEFEKVPVLQPG